MTRHPYRVRRSDRARRARLTVSREGDVVVVLPRRMPAAEADRLVSQHAAWIDRTLAAGRALMAANDARLDVSTLPQLMAGGAVLVGEPRLETVVAFLEKNAGKTPALARVGGGIGPARRVAVKPLNEHGRRGEPDGQSECDATTDYASMLPHGATPHLGATV